MRQQINLYQPIFRKREIIFSAQTLFWLALGFLVLLLLWSFLINQRVDQLQSELQRQRDAEQRAIVQLGQLRQSLPPEEPSTALESRIETLLQRRSELVDSLDALERRRPAAQARLHEQFDALARSRPHGLWLTHLYMGEQDGSLSLQGRALAARLVPLFLQALTAEPLMTGTGFRRVRVEESTDSMPGVTFLISTRPEDES